MTEIEQLTREYAMARAVLRERVEALEAEIEALKRRRLPAIRKAAETASARQGLLHDAIAEAPELFQKPKTVVFHGVKVGFQKGKGEIRWDSSEQVVKLIRKHLPEQADALIRVVERPVKTALAQLPAGELKKVGVTVVETGEQVVIRSTDTEIDRLVNALLRGSEEHQD